MIGSINTPEELLQAYTTMFLFLGSSVTTSPTEGGVPSFCEKGLLRNLPVESSNATFKKASELLMSPCPHGRECRARIETNYQLLFGVDNTPIARPLAGTWLSSDTDLKMYMNSLQILYDRYGFQKSEYCDLENDHLGIELLFVSLLIEKYLTEDDNEISEMIRRDLVTFITTDMLSWIPRWVNEISEKSLTKCYTGIAGLVMGSLEDINDILKRR